jgi:acetyl esterase/lipase
MYIGLGPQYGDSHLDRLARAFARSGYSVLIPVSEPMIAYRLSVDEHDIAVSAFRQLQRQPGVDPDRVGMFGISVGGAVVTRAAQQPEINADVAMVHVLGGFFDASQVLAQMSLRAYEVDETWYEWEPSDATFRATRNSLVPLLPSEDREEVWNLFGDDITEVPPGLTDEGQALARVLTNRDPERVDQLLAQLSPNVTEFLNEISPSHGVTDLRARTLLLHDRNDHVLPYSESVRFAEQSSVAEGDVRLTLIDHFHHVRPDEDSDIQGLSRDGLRLFRHIFAMHSALDDRGNFTSPIDLLPWVDGSDSCQARD